VKSALTRLLSENNPHILSKQVLIFYAVLLNILSTIFRYFNRKTRAA